jgi:hypothetical protein
LIGNGKHHLIPRINRPSAKSGNKVPAKSAGRGRAFRTQHTGLPVNPKN